MKQINPTHGRLVAELTSNDDVQTRRFMQVVRRLGDADVLDDANVIPDGFMVDEPNRILYAFEVEVSSKLTADKLDRYANIFWCLDEGPYEFFLVTIDRYGTGAVLDLLPLAYGFDAPVTSWTDYHFSVGEKLSFDAWRAAMGQRLTGAA
jgi:hypothetical protein